MKGEGEGEGEGEDEWRGCRAQVSLGGSDVTGLLRKKVSAGRGRGRIEGDNKGEGGNKGEGEAW